jgi:hypothetical protein
MARLMVKYGHQIDTCYDKIGLCVEILDILFDSTQLEGPLQSPKE